MGLARRFSPARLVSGWYSNYARVPNALLPSLASATHAMPAEAMAHWIPAMATK